MSEDRCVCCGVVIPEGRQICHKCESKINVVRCKECEHRSHVDAPEGRVWCKKLYRYMLEEGFCSYGKNAEYTARYSGRENMRRQKEKLNAMSKL